MNNGCVEFYSAQPLGYVGKVQRGSLKLIDASINFQRNPAKSRIPLTLCTKTREPLVIRTDPILKYYNIHLSVIKQGR